MHRLTILTQATRPLLRYTFQTATRSQSSFANLWTPKEDKDAPEFLVNPHNGFLPRHDPLTNLPRKYQALETLLEAMPLRLPDGSPGLLAKGEFGPAVQKNLPEYDISDINDPQLLLALFRDYTFATSAFVLEPCDIRYRKEGKYGPGRDFLPRNLAVPLAQISKKLGSRPFMEYAQSYALANYKRNDPNKPLDYDNLSLIRHFSGEPSEHGFILTHVAMVRHSGELVRDTINVLETVNAQDRSKFNEEMMRLERTMTEINTVMETMWKVSSPFDYQGFRTFIMGVKSQDEMFPNGVVYEGVEKQPQFYRGESGANDSIVPTVDNLLQLTELMPTNELTDILRDFRTYRPADHTKWLSWVEDKAKEVRVKDFATADPYSTLLYLKVVDQVRDFRNRHWNFAKEYILKHSKHPVATGGSPIKTWLPNQLITVLESMIDIGNKSVKDFANMDAATKAGIQELVERAQAQTKTLSRRGEGVQS